MDLGLTVAQASSSNILGVSERASLCTKYTPHYFVREKVPGDVLKITNHV